MGLFIRLYFNFNGVEPGQWEKVYDESKMLLERFPLELMRYKTEVKYGLKRGVFTADLVANKGKKDEFWRVDGDMLSRKRAETFMLYKNSYSTARDSNPNDRDVLWAKDDYLHYIEGNGYPLFENKTQGYPYHFAIMAAGILFENRFPGKAYITGDIEPWQVDVVLNWMNQLKLFDLPMLKPVCMDGGRLWKRLDAAYTDKSKMIQRFKTVFCGYEDEMLETMLQYGDTTLIREDFSQEIHRWQSLSQLGAKRLIQQWLNSTRDLDSLIRLTCLTPGNENHETGKMEEGKLEELLKVVCSMFIHHTMEERQPLHLLSITENRLHTIEDVFAQTALLLGGSRTDVDFYMSSDDLLDTFARYEPNEEKKNVFQRIIETAKKDNRQYLDKLTRTMDESREKQKNGEKQWVSVNEAPVEPLPDEPAEETPEQIIISNAMQQQEKISKPDELARAFGQSLNGFINKNRSVLQKYLDSSDRKFLLMKIIESSFEEGFGLVEKAWKDIDKEKRLPVLKAILGLSLIRNSEMNFWHWRIYLLEHKSLWVHIALDNEDKEVPPEAEKQIESE